MIILEEKIRVNLDDIETLSLQFVTDFFSSNVFSVSDDFVEFYSRFNGGCGELEDDVYIEIWNLNELIELNENYDVSKNIDNVLIFGSDGGDMALGYDYKLNKYLIVPFIGMGFLEPPYYLGDNYNSFFENLLVYYEDEEQ